MADRLKVDGTELSKFFKDLNKAKESFTALRKVLRNADVKGLGTDDLDTALSRTTPPGSGL
jgi:endonuclease III-like uncharacterized protein